MPVPSALVGRRVEPVAHRVDERWTMAYAAALGEDDPCLFDTRRPQGIVAAPLFPVCLEWPVVQAVRHLADGVLDASELRRGVHASHDVELHRPVRPPEQLWTSAEVVGVERRSPGAFQVLRLTTVDAAGNRVATTDMGTLFLGVAVQGPDRPAVPRDLPATASGAHRPSDGATDIDLRPIASIPVGATAAHLYTEGARIWNPIHTDPAVAVAAGLPSTVLHGTATLALAVGALRRHLGLPPEAVTRVRARFGALVPMPTTLTVAADLRRWAPNGTAAVACSVLLPDGAAAVRDAWVDLADRGEVVANVAPEPRPGQVPGSGTVGATR